VDRQSGTHLDNGNPLDERQTETGQSSKAAGTRPHQAERSDQSQPVEEKCNYGQQMQQQLTSTNLQNCSLYASKQQHHT